MVSLINMILQVIRDVALVIVSVLIVSYNYGDWALETSAYFILGIATGFLILSTINMTLLLKKVKEKWFFYLNAIIQLFPSLLFTMFEVWIGPLFLILNVAILVTLIERKRKQELKP